MKKLIFWRDRNNRTIKKIIDTDDYTTFENLDINNKYFESKNNKYIKFDLIELKNQDYLKVEREGIINEY